MSGFAFASIYKEPIPPGPGPDGPDIPDPPDPPEPDPTYTISGTSIVPFIPFTVTVTASNDKAHGSSGHLQYSADYNIVVLDDGGSWSSGASHTWTLYTRRCDSSLNNMQFSWLINGKEPVTATLGYNAGTMTPNIVESSVTIGSTFDFTITFSGHGANCKARSLSDFGATYWWEAQKAGKWERTNRIPVNQTPSFSNGVLSGNGYVGNLVGYDKIRLCVDYAGNETASDEAALTSSAVTITLGANSLHCFGASTSLKIESGSLELMTAAFYRGDNTTEDITDTNGTPIAFTFSGTTWTGNIQAATAATAGTVVLKIFYNNEVVATKQINVVTALYGEIEADTPIMQGESIEATGTINGGDYTLTRLPAEIVKLEVDSGALEYNAAGEDTIELSYSPTTDGIYTLQLIDTRDETILDSLQVTVRSIYAMLAEAINERMKAKSTAPLVNDYYSETSYTGSEEETTLASAAIVAMKEFGNAAFNESTGAISKYTNNNTGISTSLPEGKTELEWMKDCYDKICTATTLVGNTNSFSIDGNICTFVREVKEPSSAYTFNNVKEDGVWKYTQAECVANAKQGAEDDYNALFGYTGAWHDAEVTSYVWKYSSNSVSAKLESSALIVTMTKTLKIGATLKLYFNINKRLGNFYAFGSGLTENTYPCLATWTQAANVNGAVSPLIEIGEPQFTSAQDGNSDVILDCRASLNAMSINFDFEHK